MSGSLAWEEGYTRLFPGEGSRRRGRTKGRSGGTPGSRELFSLDSLGKRYSTMTDGMEGGKEGTYKEPRLVSESLLRSDPWVLSRDGGSDHLRDPIHQWFYP